MNFQTSYPGNAGLIYHGHQNIFLSCVPYTVVGQMTEIQMTEGTYGRKTCDRNDIWPKDIQPKIQKAERTFDRKLYSAEQISEQKKYEQQTVEKQHLISTFNYFMFSRVIYVGLS